MSASEPEHHRHEFYDTSAYSRLFRLVRKRFVERYALKQTGRSVALLHIGRSPAQMFTPPWAENREPHDDPQV